MTPIKTGAFILALAASFCAIATSASAQTRAERMAAAREARAEAQLSYWTPAQRAAAYGAYAWNIQSPNQCRTDDGYGRYDTCDH